MTFHSIGAVVLLDSCIATNSGKRIRRLNWFDLGAITGISMLMNTPVRLMRTTWPNDIWHTWRSCSRLADIQRHWGLRIHLGKRTKRTNPLVRSFPKPKWMYHWDVAGCPDRWIPFQIEFPDRPVRSKGALSSVSSLYDHVDLVSSVQLSGKVLLKRMFRNKVCQGDPNDPKDNLPREV